MTPVVFRLQHCQKTMSKKSLHMDARIVLKTLHNVKKTFVDLRRVQKAQFDGVEISQRIADIKSAALL